MALCSKCGKERERPKQRYCNGCHAAYMREWRKSHPMSEEQRLKDTVRSTAGVYKRRGMLAPQPCEVCGVDGAEMHHEDYSKPLEVKWLCRPHHVQHHHPE